MDANFHCGYCMYTVKQHSFDSFGKGMLLQLNRLHGVMQHAIPCTADHSAAQNRTAQLDCIKQCIREKHEVKSVEDCTTESEVVEVVWAMQTCLEVIVIQVKDVLALSVETACWGAEALLRVEGGAGGS